MQRRSCHPRRLPHSVSRSHPTALAAAHIRPMFVPTPRRSSAAALADGRHSNPIGVHCRIRLHRSRTLVISVPFAQETRIHKWDQEFESAFLQRRVRCEPDPLDHSLAPTLREAKPVQDPVSARCRGLRSGLSAVCLSHGSAILACRRRATGSFSGHRHYSSCSSACRRPRLLTCSSL
jgi:hypothetical protein